MATFHKIELASGMFIEAHDRFVTARRDIDYVVALMLAGAVEGIIAPLLEEQGGKTTHSLLARIGEQFSEPGDPKMHEGMFRTIYNGLKHAGNERRKISASADLELHADLRVEAGRMLDDAKQDFSRIAVSSSVRSMLPAKLIALLESDSSYA
jgi:hypothetical protein